MSDLPFGQRPSKGSFGKKPSNGTFGKKPSKGTFGKTKSIMKKKPIVISEDLNYLLWLQTANFKCFVCQERNPMDPIEWHHVKEYSTDKKNHKRLIPLCGHEHHRIGKLSPHGGPKQFREQFPIEDQEQYADDIYEQYSKILNSHDV